jgi:hypothetical protein
MRPLANREDEIGAFGAMWGSLGRSCGCYASIFNGGSTAMTSAMAAPAHDGAVPASVAPRGYGRVQRQVWRCFVAFPAKDLSTGDLLGATRDR